jgi:hypothetical protein
VFRSINQEELSEDLIKDVVDLVHRHSPRFIQAAPEFGMGF